MKINVYPCPFCMYEDVEIDEIDLKCYAVCCPNCEAIGPVSRASPEDAIARWNCASFDADTDSEWTNQIGSV